MSLPTLPCSTFPQAKEYKHKAVRLLKKETGLTFSTGDGCLDVFLKSWTRADCGSSFNNQSDRTCLGIPVTTGNIAYTLVMK